ncbi:MAG TPA: hypothetical protein VLB46_22215 [Pyrinomonadaceae bacterium]|nr:hypothetical protein [Pyrinomonadaceae bacterium]
MKVLIGLVLWFSCLASYAHPALQPSGSHLWIDSKEAQPRLILEAKIHDQRYESEQGITMIWWNLTLTYKNLGTEPVLLYKKSSLIYRSMISKSLKAALKGKYEQDKSSHFISADAMRAAGFLDRSPETSDFVTLKPGESHSVEAEDGVQRKRNPDDNSGLAPGQYFLEVKVATWYYWDDPKQYREKWRTSGYLWWENIKSEPMLFTLQ